MGNFKAAALTVALILGFSSFAFQHHGPSPVSPDFRPPNDGGKFGNFKFPKCVKFGVKLNLIVIVLPIPT